MPSRHEVIAAAAEVENKLRVVFQTNGRMFGEIAQEISDRVPKDIRIALSNIATVRAQYAHWSDAELDAHEGSKNFAPVHNAFWSSIERVNQYLGSRGEPQFSMPQYGSAFSGASMANSNGGSGALFSGLIIPDPIAGLPRIRKRALKRDCHVVFLRKGAPEAVATVVKGFVHPSRAALLCDSAVGVAKEMTFDASYVGSFRSSDGIAIGVSIHVEFEVVSNPPDLLLSIVRESQEILNKIEGGIDMAIRQYCSKHKFYYLSDQGELQSHQMEIGREIVQNISTIVEIRPSRFQIAELRSSDSSVKSLEQMNFETSRKLRVEAEQAREREVWAQTESAIRMVANRARLDAAEVDAAIHAVRARAREAAGVNGFSEENLVKLIAHQIYWNGREGVANNSSAAYFAAGVMEALRNRRVTDSSIRFSMDGRE